MTTLGRPFHNVAEGMPTTNGRQRHAIWPYNKGAQVPHGSRQFIDTGKNNASGRTGNWRVPDDCRWRPHRGGTFGWQGQHDAAACVVESEGALSGEVRGERVHHPAGQVHGAARWIAAAYGRARRAVAAGGGRTVVAAGRRGG